MDKISDYTDQKIPGSSPGGVVALINFEKSCNIFSLLSKMFQFIRSDNHLLRIDYNDLT